MEFNNDVLAAETKGFLCHVAAGLLFVYTIRLVSAGSIGSSTEISAFFRLVISHFPLHISL